MTEQEKLLYNLVKDFIHAVKLDQHDCEDWPEDSREAFEKMQSGLNALRDLCANKSPAMRSHPYSSDQTIIKG